MVKCERLGSTARSRKHFQAAAVVITFSYMNDLRKRGLLAVPGISVCLLPKLTCPACWPACLLSSLGLRFLISTAYLLPLTAGFLVVSLGIMALRAKNRRGYGPFLIGLAAASAILLAKFAWKSNPVVYSALGVLIMSSAWDAWPPENANVEITQEKKTTKTKKKVEIFIAGCPLCERTIQLVMGLVDSSHQVVISDMRRPDVASRAEQYGIRTVPAVVIDGELTACCKRRGCDEQVLRSALREQRT